MPLSFSAFGRKVDLLLEKNDNLLAPDFEIWKRSEDGTLRKEQFNNSPSCYYLYNDSASSAAVSLCDDPSGVVGFCLSTIFFTPFKINSQKRSNF